MRQRDLIIITAAAAILFGGSCMEDPGIDKKKFSALGRTARVLKDAIPTDRPCAVPEPLLQRLVSGTAALKDKTVSKGERDVLAAYSRLLETYRDGLLLCRLRTRLKEFYFLPRGRIYVFQELDPIVEKYHLPTERHQYEPTGAYWRSIAGDSITVIWKIAEVQTKNIETMVNYN